MRILAVMLISCLLLGAAGCRSGRQVVPVPGSSDVVTATQVEFRCELAGVELLPGYGEAEEDLYEVTVQRPRDVSRRILPGDIPDTGGVGTVVVAGDGGWLISGLPEAHTLLLQVVFTPAVDLVNGGAWAGAEPREHALLLPVDLTGGEAITMAARVEFTPEDAGGYRGAIKLETTAEDGVTDEYICLDYGQGLVSRDNDADGDYGDEAWLADEARFGVSPWHVEWLAMENEVGNSGLDTTLVHGVVDGIDEDTATCRLTGVECWPPVDGFSADTLELSYSEAAGFLRRIIDDEGEHLTNSPPAELNVSGTAVTVQAALVPATTGGPATAWAGGVERLELDLPDDSIAAVPLTREVAPGTPVTVTVYANRTANPFHAVENLRVALGSGNSYEADSFNAGDRGGAADFADGVWRGLGAGTVNLGLEPVRTASEDGGEEVSSLDVSLEPAAGSDLVNASGPLFNYRMVCHREAVPVVIISEDGSTVTSFRDSSGHSYRWSRVAAGTASVGVAGDPLVLDLASPPALGAGEWKNPYLVDAGAGYALQLIDPVQGDVTRSAEVTYTVESRDPAAVTVTDGELMINTGYTGPVSVSAVYQGIYSSPAQPHLFVDDLAACSLDVHEPKTYIYGGSAEAIELELTPRGDALQVDVVARGAVGLRAADFTLYFNPELYQLAAGGPTPASREGGWVISPEPYMLDTRSREGLIDYCQVVVQPGENPGFTGTGSIVTFELARWPVPSSAMDFHLPDTSCAEPAWDAPGERLAWKYLMPGDFDQDGMVYVTNTTGRELTDISLLGVYFGTEGIADPDSIEYVMDRWDQTLGDFGSDGLVTIFEVGVFGRCYLDRISGWNIYGGASGDYPADGSLLDFVPFSSYAGDPSAERIHFSWRPVAVQPGTVYWLRPVFNGETGEPSDAVEVP